MRIAILSPDATGKIDGTVHSQILDHLPGVTTILHGADLVIVPVSYFPDIQFNPRLNEIKQPWVLMDFMEYGSAWDQVDTHIFGRNKASILQTAGWNRFDDWVNANPPKLIFKRELLAKDACSTIKPIEFLCYLDRHPIQAREEYNARPLDVSFIWGFSSAMRPRLHGDIFKGMSTHGIGVISDWDQFHPHFCHNPPSRTWATCHIPWYARKPIADVMWMNERSKIGVSCFGNGLKSFRSSEMRSTIMAMPEDNLEWSYPWIHGENCLRFRDGHEFSDLMDFTSRDDLYDIYLKCQENLENYRIDKYIPNYILPNL
jgi:hypothetical protein